MPQSVKISDVAKRTSVEDRYPDITELLPSWELALRAERQSPQTVKSYGDGVRQYIAWCRSKSEAPTLNRALVSGFVADMLDRGNTAATARARQLAVRRFSAWLVEEGELDSDPLLGLRAPKLDTKVIEPLSEDQLKALLKACAGPDMRDRRDAAIVRLMAETGIRAGECAALQLTDMDLTAGLVVVRRGKGGKGRTVPIGPQTALAIDRYLRQRRGHLLASTGALWLGDRGKPFNYDGLHKSLRYRASIAGIPNFHPHLLRHTAVSRWLAAGGSEGGLMAVAGWSRREMLSRYTAARASDRAADEARTLGLGEL
jgi:site-specific recombinase XerD